MNTFGITVEYCKSGSVEAICVMSNGARVQIRDYATFAAEHDYADSNGQLTRIRRGVGRGVSRVGFAFARRLARRELQLIATERERAELIASAMIVWFDAANRDGYMWFCGQYAHDQKRHPLNASCGDGLAPPSYYLGYLAQSGEMRQGSISQAIMAALFRAGRPLIAVQRIESSGGHGYGGGWRLGHGPAQSIPELESTADITAWRSIL